MSFLNFDFHESANEIQPIPHEKFLPFAASELHTRKVKKFKILAEGPTVKTICELVLDIENMDCDFKPGDAIGILPHNDPSEIDAIIFKLGWQHIAIKPYTLNISANTTKKKAAIPKHLPQTSTIRTLFEKYVDVRSIPKKLFLKGLLNFTTSKEDRQKLENLSNSKSYEHFINNEGRTLLKLLTHLPSCQPTAEFLFENLPPLQPRYYSVASSPKVKNELTIVFSITINPDETKGVCTGFLETAKEVEFYFRKSSEFLKFKDDFGVVILVGIGSGLAPFLGYLQDVSFQKDAPIDKDNDHISKDNDSIRKDNDQIHEGNDPIKIDKDRLNRDNDSIRKGDNPIRIDKDDVAMRNLIEKNSDSLNKNMNCSNINSVKKDNPKIRSGLYFGCRYPNVDFIYREQLTIFLEDNILDWLSTAFSRFENLHVQDKIEQDGLKIVDYLLRDNAAVCVCGDGNMLGESIEEKLIELLVDFGGKSLENAREYLKNMREEKRFQLDIW